MTSLKTPLEMFYHWEKKCPEKIYMNQPVNRELVPFNWKKTGEEVRRMAAYLTGLGYPPGTNIAIISKNCAHWIMADLAIWMAGYVSVPLYPNLTAESIRQILEHSEAKAIFIGKLDGWNGMKPGLTSGIHKISFPFSLYKTTEDYEQWDKITAKSQPMTENPARSPAELATIIYTSGTTGTPKGVMHKFKQLSFCGTYSIKEVMATEDERFFSYLPLSHCAERLLVEMGSLYSGGTIFFAESLDTFAEDLRNARPTVFLGVPRIWGKFHDGILTKLPQKKLDTLLSIPLISSLIRKKIKKGLGLDAARLMITGAAPMPASMMHWFKKLGMLVQEAYGMTENMAYSHYMRPDSWEPGTVGSAWPHVDVRISAEGEIQIKSDATMEGYFKAPDLTKEMMDGEYLKTGDQGVVEADGNLKITGRVKDLFKTSKGKYVAPSPIELKFSASEAVECVCVVGSGLPQPVALVTKSEIGKKLAADALSSELDRLLGTVNSTLDAHERVSHVVVVKDDWTVENGILTPTMKIKRGEVEKRYAKLCEVVQNEKGKVASESGLAGKAS